MLPRSLAAVRDAVDEIIVVDTGSTDRTIEIAESFGAKVIEREWTGSFADARNVSFDAATGDWVMFLDADEVLVADDAQRLREVLGRTWREAFYLVETNFTGELGDGTAVTHNALRVFRNRPEYRFEGRIHEQIAHNLPSGQPERIEITDVRVEHYGYLGVVRDAKDKSRRNIELLERQRDEGGEETGFLHFNLGSEYAALGENDERLRELRDAPGRSCAAGPTWPPTATSRRSSRASCAPRRLTGDLDGADRRSPTRACASCPASPTSSSSRPRPPREAGRTDAAIALLERCLEMGDAPEQVLGDRRARQLPRARRAREPAPPRRRRRRRRASCSSRCLDDHPQYVGAVGPYALALLADGAGPDDDARRRSRPASTAADRRAPASSSAPPSTRPRTPRRPRSQFRAVVAAQPQNAGARVALAESAAVPAPLGRGRRGRRPASSRRRAVRRRRPPHRAVRPDRRRRRRRRGRRRRPRRRRPRPGRARRLRRLAPHRRRRDRRCPVPADGVPVLVVAFEALLRVEEFDAVAARPAGDRALGAAGPRAAASCSRTSTCAAASSSPPATSGWPPSTRARPGRRRVRRPRPGRLGPGRARGRDRLRPRGRDPRPAPTRGASGLAERMEAAALASSSV